MVNGKDLSIYQYLLAALLAFELFDGNAKAAVVASQTLDDSGLFVNNGTSIEQFNVAVGAGTAIVAVGYKCTGSNPTATVVVDCGFGPVGIEVGTTLCCDGAHQVLSLGTPANSGPGTQCRVEFYNFAGSSNNYTYRYQATTNPDPASDALGPGLGAGDDLYYVLYDAIPAPTVCSNTGTSTISAPFSPLILFLIFTGIGSIGFFRSKKLKVA